MLASPRRRQPQQPLAAGLLRHQPQPLAASLRHSLLRQQQPPLAASPPPSLLRQQPPPLAASPPPSLLRQQPTQPVASLPPSLLRQQPPQHPPHLPPSLPRQQPPRHPPRLPPSLPHQQPPQRPQPSQRLRDMAAHIGLARRSPSCSTRRDNSSRSSNSSSGTRASTRSSSASTSSRSSASTLLHPRLPPTATSRTPYTDTAATPILSGLVKEAVSTGTTAARQRTLRDLRGSSLLEAVEHLLRRRLPQVAPATVRRDISNVSWWARRLWPEEQRALAPTLADVGVALTRRAATRPRRKALPMGRAALDEIRPRLPLAQRTLVTLAYRTASRVGDLVPLRGQDLTLDDGCLLVRFGVTKSNQGAAARADHQLLVPRPEPELLLLLRRPPGAALFRKEDVRLFRLLLRRTPVSPTEIAQWQRLDPQAVLRTRFTGHSMKRGAAAAAWQAAAQGELTVPQVLHLLKHRTVESSIAYCPAPAWVAQALAGRAAAVTAAPTTPRQQ